MLRGLDISNFFPAISILERAKNTCKSHEYEDDVIYSLANSYFYVGEFSQAKNNYMYIAKKFPSSSFNTGQNTATEEYRFIEDCMGDPRMDSYRKAEVYEIHREFNNAIKQYMFARDSNCSELSRRSAKKVRLLEYMQ
jgi:tetratricopeptide (TPR) repeat protein